MPQLHPGVFRVRLANWQSSSKAILPRMDELQPAERQAAQWLLTAWRDSAYSQAVADRAAEEIRQIEAADVAHGANLELRTITMGFRGIARTMYCSGGDVYAQFQQALCAQAGIPVPTRAYSSAAADMPAAASLSVCVYRDYRIVERDVTTLGADTSGMLRVTMVLNNLTKDKTYHFVFELVDRAGRVVKTNAVPYTARASSGTWAPDIFQCGTIPAGEYTLRIKIGGNTLLSRTLTKRGATPRPVDPSGPHVPYPVTPNVSVESISVFQSSYAGTHMDSGSTILATAQYITPKITVTSDVPDPHLHTFTVSIITPSGTLLTDSSSPRGATYSTQRTISGGRTTLRLRPWGSDSGHMYAVPGMWKIIVRTEDGREFSHTFPVRRPTAAPIHVTLDRVLFKKDADTGEFTANLPSKPTVLQPQLRFASRLDGVHEIGYEIQTTDGLRVVSYPARNIRVNGPFVTLPPVKLTSTLDDREYQIIPIIDGQRFDPHRFRVGGKEGSCLTILLWTVGLPLLGGIISALI